MGERHKAGGGRPLKKKFSAMDPRGGVRKAGFKKAGDNAKPGEVSKKAGKVVSYKNRIRGLERLLKKVCRGNLSSLPGSLCC
jgi:hypothetical protein